MDLEFGDLLKEITMKANGSLTDNKVKEFLGTKTALIEVNLRTF